MLGYLRCCSMNADVVSRPSCRVLKPMTRHHPLLGTGLHHCVHVWQDRGIHLLLPPRKRRRRTKQSWWATPDSVSTVSRSQPARPAPRQRARFAARGWRCKALGDQRAPRAAHFLCKPISSRKSKRSHVSCRAHVRTGGV